jgi:hypothetical protein
MAGHTEIYRLLKQMEGVVYGSDALCLDGLATAAWTDDAALRQVAGLLRSALRVLDGESDACAVAMTSPAQQSSVQIEGRQKGPPAVTVKVYDADPAEALVAATTLYDQAVAKYSSSHLEHEAAPRTR